MKINVSPKARKLLVGLLPLLGILCCLLFFYRAFLAGKVFGWHDDLFQFYPGANYFARSIESGVFPFWLPNLRCGMPFYSDVQMGLFYPLKWLLVLFVNHGELSQQAYQVYLVFQYFIGGTLFYALMRMHKSCKAAAASGAVVYCFSGFSALHIIFFASVEVMFWLPLVLISIKYYFVKKSFQRVLLISLAVLMMFLPGFPQITLYVSYFSIAYWVILSFLDALDKKKSKAGIAIGLLRELGIVASVFSLALVMGAALFLPAFENWQLSARSTYGYDMVADTSMPFYYVVNMFFPNFTGMVKPVGDAVQYWGFNRDSIGFETYNTAYWHYWDLSCYAGQIGIVALLYSVVFIRSFWRSPLRLTCTLGALFALWFMLGRYGGLFKVLYEVLPGISVFRGPGRMSCVLNASQAVLAVYFVNDLVRGENLQKIRRFISVVLGLYILFLIAFLLFGKQACKAYENAGFFNFSIHQILVSLGFLGVIVATAFLAGRERFKRYQGVVFVVLFVSVFCDLYAAHGNFHKGHKKASDFFGDRGGLITELQAYQKQNGICRFGQVFDGRINENVILPRNVGLMQEIEVPEGYVLFSLSSIRRVRENLPEEMMRDLLNIGLLFEESPEGGAIWVRQPFFPRAAFYSKVAIFDSRDELFEAVRSKAVDYNVEVAVLRSDINAKLFADCKDEGRAPCSIQKTDNNNWKVSFRSEQAGILFVSQAYYPGWHALDRNGIEYNVIETFGGLTGIVIPEAYAGEITLSFFPAIFMKGLAISIGSISLITVICIYLLVFRKKNSS